MKKLILLFGLFIAIQVHASPNPGAVSATGTAHSTTFTWTPASQPTGITVAGYNLYCAPTSGGETAVNPVNGSTLITGTSYVDTSVTAGTTQFCVMTADTTGGAQQSAFSNEVTFTTPSNPNPPTLSITSVAININGNNETVTAQWTNSNNVGQHFSFSNGTNFVNQGDIAPASGSFAEQVTVPVGTIVTFSVQDATEAFASQQAM
jgi:hypothetical protein